MSMKNERKSERNYEKRDATNIMAALGPLVEGCLVVDSVLWLLAMGGASEDLMDPTSLRCKMSPW
jgi:hypothetical protein